MRILSRAFLLSLLLLPLLASGAQAWEWAYGPFFTWDQAFRRVAPVTNCPAPGQGYIAVGTYDQLGVNPEVYVVYTPVAGGPPFWENTYDVQAAGMPDEGMAIAAVPNGFVVLSNSQNAAGVWSPALTLITCNGLVAWTQVYPDVVNGWSVWGRDLIRTQTGAPGSGMAPGDLVVAGYAFNGFDDDAFLMRTNAGGGLLWDVLYDNINTSEAFNAVTENLQGANLTGDLVAAGRFTQVNGDLQGLVARVNGNNCLIGTAPQCIQTWPASRTCAAAT